MALSITAPYLSLTYKWAVLTLGTIDLITAHQRLLSRSLKDHGMQSMKILHSFSLMALRNNADASSHPH